MSRASLSSRHSSKKVGVISDTHGLLRPEAVAALRGSEVIIHAGDIGSPAVLEDLAKIAPVFAVRGNNDRDDWARALPLTDVVEVGGLLVYLLHDIADLDLDPAAAGMSAVITGHSHKPLAETRDGVLFLNPGSAGPRRFNLPIAVARLSVVDGRLGSEIVHLG
ncbi:MAG TPA: metallophosphoesterase family protein [Burkholderiales bacterium]|nr:metallophosphoesterase family protein [Burkholderiales bacterium]